MAVCPEDLTDARGAYLLLISVVWPVELPKRFEQRRLPPGYYGYAGSAYGSGGIRARCRRHLQGPTTLRWHIDWVTQQADDIQAYGFPGESECCLTAALMAKLQAHCPIRGFGNTDCKRCRAHLVEFDHQPGARQILEALSRKTSS